MSRRQILRAFAVVALVLVTVGLFEWAPRYEASGPELLRNGGFSEGLEGWTVLGGEVVATASGAATLVNRDPSRSVGIRQTLPVVPGQGTLLLTAEVSTGDVRKGVKSWQDARVYLVGRDAQGKFLWGAGQVVLADLTGTNAWRRYSSPFRIPENASDVVVGAYLVRATGVARVRNLHLIPVRERATFLMVAYVLLATWAVALAWIGGALFRGVGSALRVGLVAVVGLAISVGALMPGPVKQKLLGSALAGYADLRAALSAVLPRTGELKWGEPEYLGVDSSQAGHFALFLLLAVFVRFAWPADRAALRITGLLLFAAATETLQYYVVGRQPSVFDWLFDAGGIFLAVILLGLFGLGRGNLKAQVSDRRNDAENPPS